MTWAVVLTGLGFDKVGATLLDPTGVLEHIARDDVRVDGSLVEHLRGGLVGGGAEGWGPEQETVDARVVVTEGTAKSNVDL